ncbi:MAG: type II toxin-antitoxin system VapC family toxin [Verrucomicrobiales bacterium]|nr:type II toxin-antitoxin system VapC family toxin [Verrucomicrobiales bacterium]
MRYLLDTCTFLWLALPQGRLSASAKAILDDSSNEFFLGDTSVWEICLKHGAGRLPLPAEPRAWLPSRMAFFQIAKLPLTHSAFYRSGELPPVHGDPFDRLLAAHAMEEGLIILSPDESLSKLGAARMW